MAMVISSLPEDPEVLAAIGAVAIRHGQLEYALRMTVKSISGITRQQALDATQGKRSSDLCRLIRKMARKELGDTSDSFLLLNALLTRSQESTRRRNDLLHGLWTFDIDEGREQFRHKGTEPRETPAAGELQTLAEEISHLANDLHEARLHGFLKEALNKAKAKGKA